MAEDVPQRSWPVSQTTLADFKSDPLFNRPCSQSQGWSCWTDWQEERSRAVAQLRQINQSACHPHEKTHRRLPPAAFFVAAIRFPPGVDGACNVLPMDREEVSRNRTVLIASNRIVVITGPQDEIPAGVQVINGNGQFCCQACGTCTCTPSTMPRRSSPCFSDME